jgi:glycosyltransferase involved in cell wall biosynthesis
MPVWNEVAHIERTVLAAVAAMRAWGNASLIVIDNGSTDGTWEVLQHLAREAPMEVIRKPGDAIGALRNEGARKADGEILAFLDADCLIADDYFFHAWAALEATGATATGSPARPPVPPHRIEDVWFRLHDRDQDGPVRYLGSGNLVLRRDAFEAAGGFDPSLRTGEDAELALRLRTRGNTLHRARKVAAYHLSNPRTLPDFCRRQWWHGLGVVRPFSTFDRPFFMSLTHLAVTVSSLVILLARPGLKTLGAALLAQALVPALTVAVRLRASRRSVPVLPAFGLYWLYYWCRLAALSTLTLRWPRPPRGWKPTAPSRVPA